MDATTRLIIGLCIGGVVFLTVIWYLMSGYNDTVFYISVVVLVSCLYVLTNSHRAVESFTDSVSQSDAGPVLNIAAYRTLINLGSKVGEAVYPSLEHVIKAFKGDDVPYNEDGGAAGAEDGEQDQETANLDPVLLKRMKTLKQTKNKELIAKYEKLNMVLTHAMRVDPDKYTAFMARFQVATDNGQKV